MVLKAQESASKYSSPYKADENLTPCKTPKRKNAENVQGTPSRRVSFNKMIVGATTSKNEGTPTKSALKKRDSVMGTPKSRVSLQLHSTPSSKQQKPAAVEKTPSRLRSQTRAGKFHFSSLHLKKKKLYFVNSNFHCLYFISFTVIQKSIAQSDSDDGDFSSDEESFKPSDESSVRLYFHVPLF